MVILCVQIVSCAVGIVVTSYSANVQSLGMMMNIDSNEKQGLSVGKTAKVV